MSDGKSTAVTIVPREQGVALEVQGFRERMEFESERLRMMKEFVRGQMTEGIHFGKIPGTSGRKTLMKPGAELLVNIHGLATQFVETEREIDREAVKKYRRDGREMERKGYVKYSFKCILSKNGTVVGEGVGTCNSWERKYLGVDLDDVENTVMKMSKKRAFTDGVLTATRTSDFFSQDLEDAEERPAGAARTTTATGASDDGPPPDEPGSNDGPPPEEHANKGEAVISDKQRGRLFAISKKAQEAQGWSDQDLVDRMKAVLKRFGYESTKEIQRKDYDAIVNEAESWKAGL